jgi:hypothetical protein
MIRKDSALLLVGIAGSVALAACGGAGEAKAPAKAAEPASTTAPEREPTSIEEAQEQIARANADLSGDGKKADVDKDSAVRPPSPGAGSTSSTTTAPREEAGRSAPADSCSQSCRALSSMRRAVSALCRMTGEEDARCSDAKKTLQQSESRVARCHCGA